MKVDGRRRDFSTTCKWSRPALGPLGVCRLQDLDCSSLSECYAFANQNALIKVLPFQGSYGLTTSISDHFPRVSCKRVCCSFDGSRASISYCRCANGLHSRRTGIQEEAAGR